MWLYQHILEFQFKSVLRFYRSWLRKLPRDLINHDNWNGMLSKIRKFEQTVYTESKTINTLAPTQVLEQLRESAEGSLETVKQLLSVAKRQFQVQEAGLQYEKEITKHTKDGRYVSGCILVAHQPLS